MLRALTVVALMPFVFLMGCVYALPVASRATDVKLRIQAAQPERYAIRVATEPTNNYAVAADGRVSFTVPPLRRGCSVYLFGVIKIADGTPERIRAVELRRGERVLRRLSLTQLTKLPEDESGYRVVRD